MIINTNMSIDEKLSILSDAAKFDVACTSSGTERGHNSSDGLGNAHKSGICHAFSSDGRCISLLKILFTNECIFDCKYCINRSSNDVARASFTPEEVATLTIEFYRRNYIEGLFLSSGIINSPNHTSELLYETLRLLRVDYKFNGYIHIKTIPGTDNILLDKIGWFADRMSVNLELPTTEGLRTLAPHKNRKNILTPMRHIQNGIGKKECILLDSSTSNNKLEVKKTSTKLKNDNIITKNLIDSELIKANTHSDNILSDTLLSPNIISNNASSDILEVASASHDYIWKPKKISRVYVPAGQSTQMIIGATPESDFQLINVTESLYNNFNLKRVFFSAYVNVNHDTTLPAVSTSPPLLREHRLYQADWLLRFYGFKANDLLSEEKPNFNVFLDPKCDWALRHLDIFPIEINKASYYDLLKVPGIGVNSAKRIISSRRSCKLDFAALKKLGVVLKRALYFITCNGSMMYHTKIEEDYILNNLLDNNKSALDKLDTDISYKQISLFDDYFFLESNNKLEVSY